MRLRSLVKKLKNDVLRKKYNPVYVRQNTVRKGIEEHVSFPLLNYYCYRRKETEKTTLVTMKKIK